eukprot:5774818-Pyramimonas_sp.AAC.1
MLPSDGKSIGDWGYYRCGGRWWGTDLLLRAHLHAARRGGGSPSSRRCGGTASCAALSSYLNDNALDDAIPTELGLLTGLVSL